MKLVTTEQHRDGRSAAERRNERGKVVPFALDRFDMSIHKRDGKYDWMYKPARGISVELYNILVQKVLTKKI